MNAHIPNSFQHPNVYVDDYMNLLSGDEFKIMTVVIRKTFGWQKQAAPIAESEAARLTGLHRLTVHEILKRLVEFCLVAVVAENDPTINAGKTYAPQLDPAVVRFDRLNERAETKARRAVEKISKARGNIKPKQKTLVCGTDQPPSDAPQSVAQTTPQSVAQTNPLVCGTDYRKPNETQSKPKPEPADAGAGSGEAPPKKPIDGVTDFFNRAASANEQAAGDEKARLVSDARKVFGKWNLPAYLSELAAAFVDVFCVAPDNAGKNQEGKWVAGLSRLYGQNPTPADLQAARRRAADARPTPLTITHPGAIVETLKAIKAERMAQTPALSEEDFVTVIDADGYERAVPKSKAHLYASQHAAAVPA